MEFSLERRPSFFKESLMFPFVSPTLNMSNAICYFFPFHYWVYMEGDYPFFWKIRMLSLKRERWMLSLFLFHQRKLNVSNAICYFFPFHPWRFYGRRLTNFKEPRTLSLFSFTNIKWVHLKKRWTCYMFFMGPSLLRKFFSYIRRKFYNPMM